MAHHAAPGSLSFSRRVARLRRRATFDRVSFLAVFLVVPVALFVIFELSPMVQALYYGMTNWRGFSATMDFVGFRNYVQMFSDTKFLISMRNSALLVVVVPTITLVLSFAIAAVVTTGGRSIGRVEGLKGGGIHRVVSFFPYTVPAIVVGLIWAQVYDPSRGLLNGVLKAIGFKQFQGFAWIGQVSTAMPSSMFVIVWSFVGFYTVLFVAAIKGIPAETYEAARIDGAGRFRTAIAITLPQIADTVRTAYIYLGLAAIDAFVYMQALNPQGGPDFSTLTMSQNLYMEAFKGGNFGYATAIGVVLAAVTMAYAGVIFVVFRLLRGKDDGMRAS
ncbi:MAG: sugar ABC transporter permease [Propionibacteriaceae bacterium]|jgi:N-acetylglucosamine transport system permease protein|nr:sugar ABC transporter permease [Propionibacteriaceae bacterium]